MRAHTITHPVQEGWNAFIQEQGGSFLQSYEWGEFHRKTEKGVVYCQVLEEERVVMQAVATRWTFPLGTYLSIFLGPVASSNLSQLQYSNATNLLVKNLSLVGKKAGDVFLRVEPAKELSKEKAWRVPTKRTQPSRTHVLDLSLSLEKITAGFHKNTRYSIAIAQKKGVKVSSSASYDPSFFLLMKKTTERQGFYSHREDYYKKLCEIQGKDVCTELFLAKKDGQVLATAIVVFAFSRATLLHAASDHDFRDLLAPHLLQSGIIQRAKEKGCLTYDFWGIDEKKYPGTSAFKKRFGGLDIVYPKGGELPLNAFSYTIYTVTRKLKKILFS